MKARLSFIAACLAAFLAASLGPTLAVAHDAAHDVAHGQAVSTPVETARLPFPIDLKARFDLIDHRGQARSEADFAGRPMLVFFGYASCTAMCDVVLPRMADALRRLGPEEAGELAPLFISVDAEGDTPAVMAKAVARHDTGIDAGIIGLTGDAAALAAARASFQVEASHVGTAPGGTPIFAHGTMIYLIGGDGRLLSLIPPVLDAEAIAGILRRDLGRPHPVGG